MKLLRDQDELLHKITSMEKQIEAAEKKTTSAIRSFIISSNLQVQRDINSKIDKIMAILERIEMDNESKKY